MKLDAMDISFLVLMTVAAVMSLTLCAHERGAREGACIELCRPAKYDEAQRVNGGCLCIGSDKVLRIKKAP